MYKFWLSRKERAKLDEERKLKEATELFEKWPEFIAKCLVNTKNTELWHEFFKKDGSNYEAVKAVMDKIDPKDFAHYVDKENWWKWQ